MPPHAQVIRRVLRQVPGQQPIPQAEPAAAIIPSAAEATAPPPDVANQAAIRPIKEIESTPFSDLGLLILLICGFCIRRCFKKRRAGKDGKKGKGIVDLKSVQLLGSAYKEKASKSCPSWKRIQGVPISHSCISKGCSFTTVHG
ncbi:unnamed protein product [Nesidiocoris tenuis]|uniref:Uncharacterized protein n=1 Tax=Nesidiocoris tenuis TaxID=355587 RepID=A0A6H5H9P2_9HEMI|nr:unnamed protein product [Nesidiocoris tenuis]